MAKTRKRTEEQVRKDEAQDIKDEADAEKLYQAGVQQAAVERDRVLDALDVAHDEAAKQPTAPAAKKTFWQSFKDFFAGDGM